MRTLAHAEGGGVLYVHSAADPAKALALVAASLDRLGVCNRLNLAARRPRRGRARPRPARAARASAASRCAAPSRARCRSTARSATSGRARPSAWRRSPSPLVESLDEAVRIANEETSGLAAGIVTEDAAAAERFLDRYRGTVGFWHAPTRFADGFELTGAPETGINVDWTPGPRGPVTYRDLWLRQYRVVGDATQTR